MWLTLYSLCCVWIIVVLDVNGEKNTVELIFGGDVTFYGVIDYHVRMKNCTFNESFKYIKNDLNSADFSIVNLETPFCEHDELEIKQNHKPMNLISNVDSMSALRYGGINAVTLANNHIQDFGDEGANITIQNLKRIGVDFFGITKGKKKKYIKQKPLVLEKNGIKVGFLGYCNTRQACLDGSREKGYLGPALFDPNFAIKEMKSLRKKVDVIVVFMHWEPEYTVLTNERSSLLQMHPYFDILIGSHPHITQGHFYHKGKLIATSLGNLLFPMFYSPSTWYKSGKKVKDNGIIEKVWYKSATVLKNPTKFGRLLKVVVNKNGVVRKSTYLDTELQVNERHCLIITRKEKTNWKTICGKNDPNCLGTDSCNPLECDGLRTFH